MTLRLVLLTFCVTPVLHAQSGDSLLTIERIFGSHAFAQKSLQNVQWVDGGKKFSYLDMDTASATLSLFTYTVASGKRELVMSGKALASHGETPMRIGSYQWSPDFSKILVTGTLPARRTKTGGNFGVYDLDEQSFRLLTDTTAHQAIMQWSPDNRHIGFVREHNLFMIDAETGQETQLTFDGSPDILNGMFDWAYEEEFSIINGFAWSPDGSRIAFWRLDQSRVPTFPLIQYPEDEAHPLIEQTHYPKAGDPVSRVKIGVMETATMTTTWIVEDSTGYIPRIQWTNDSDILCYQRLNRLQDTLDLVLADVRSGVGHLAVRETSPAWVDIVDHVVFLDRSDEFIWMSSRDGHMHLYRYAPDGKPIRQLTHGDWEVVSVAGVNERMGAVYFTATEHAVTQRHLYRVRLDGTGLKRISREEGWHAIRMSPNNLVYIDTHSSMGIPPVTSLRTNDGARIATLVRNTLDSLAGVPLGKSSFFRFTTRDSVSLNGWRILPVDFDSTRRYPVLMFVYGGPGSQTVTDSWGGSNYLWYQMLAEKGYMVVSVDNRGTGGRGTAFMQGTYKHLGILETHDFVETAHYLGTLPWVDSTRLGIWGWSGGGYYTCMAMTLGAGAFKTGIAVAPVTDFRFYDAIWTERYMQRPVDNPDGYRESSPITYASRLQGNLLIIHGTEDDNVHWQNTIVFVDELIRQKKQVQTMFYPGKAHGIGGAAVHLYTMMTQFLLDHL